MTSFTMTRRAAFLAVSLLMAITGSSSAAGVGAGPVSPPSKSCAGGPSNADQPFGVSKSRSAHAALCVRGGEVTEVKTLDEAKDIIAKASEDGKLVVIDFTATWCGPCKMIAPVYQELSDSEEMKKLGVVFLKVDVDENQDTAAEYNVSAMPTFIFVKDGDVKDRLMGANAPRLNEMILDLA